MVIVHSQKVYVGFVLHTARKKILFKNVKSVFRFREWMNDGKFFFNNPSINSFFPVKLCRLKKRTNVKKKIITNRIIFDFIFYLYIYRFLRNMLIFDRIMCSTVYVVGETWLKRVHWTVSFKIRESVECLVLTQI